MDLELTQDNDLHGASVRVTQYLPPRRQGEPEVVRTQGETKADAARRSAAARGVELEDRSVCQRRGVVFGARTVLLRHEREPEAPVEAEAGRQVGAVDDDQIDPDAHP